MMHRNATRAYVMGLLLSVLTTSPGLAQIPVKSAPAAAPASKAGTLEDACAAKTANKAVSVVDNYVTVSVGDAGGARAQFRFVKERGSREALVIATCAAGAAGAKLAISAGDAATPIYAHTFTAEECRQKDGADACVVMVPRETAAARQLTRAFYRNKSGRVRVATQGGAMMLDKELALDGFSRMMRDKAKGA